MNSNCEVEERYRIHDSRTRMPSITDLVHVVVLAMAVVKFVLAPVIRQRMGFPVSIPALGIRLHRFLDRGGLIYRKLGQYLAMRNDLLPPGICAELDLLFEEVTAMPFTEVKATLEAELGCPWEECFALLEPEPIGSGSVAQVHRAVALDGDRLAVKVQRTGVREEFATDARVFRGLAELCDLFRVTGPLHLRELFDEFVRFTEREMDFELEGRTADRLRRQMSPHGDVPSIRWDLSTSRVLSMEYVEGRTFLTLCRLHDAGRGDEVGRLIPIEKLEVAVTNLADECFRQLFITGFFHGDPHPGNAILRDDGSFVFLDCGISGELPPDHRANLSGFVESLALGRFAESASFYTHLCVFTSATDPDAWMNDIVSALADWFASVHDPHSPIKHRHIGHLQGQIASAMRRNSVLTLPNQVLVWRALVLLDTTTLRLPIRFDVLDALADFFRHTRSNFGFVIRPFRNFALETPGLIRILYQPVRELIGARDKSGPLTAVCSATKVDRCSKHSGSRVVFATLGVACGTLAASAGGGTMSSVVAVASVVLFVFAVRG